MKRIQLIVSYEGTNYNGWQKQPSGVTIEGVLNRTLTELLREPVTVTGASRTDSGVHSLGNVAVFDTSARIPAEKICYALNQRSWMWTPCALPDSIWWEPMILKVFVPYMRRRRRQCGQYIIWM